MGETLEAWLEKHAGREDAHAHQVLENAKLITTFAAAFAATFVATALAEGPAPSCWDWGAVAAMGLALLGVLAVIFRTRKGPDVRRTLNKSSGEIWSDDLIVGELRKELMRSVEDNMDQASKVRRIMLAQVVASMVACVLAVVSVHDSFSP
jgi:hypothetical protein